MRLNRCAGKARWPLQFGPGGTARNAANRVTFSACVVRASVVVWYASAKALWFNEAWPVLARPRAESGIVRVGTARRELRGMVAREGPWPKSCIPLQLSLAQPNNPKKNFAKNENRFGAGPSHQQFPALAVFGPGSPTFTMIRGHAVNLVCCDG